tara:strand:- start:259 stop:1056 length:798 start_codon:yes stop_codon:yes gene_type:complete
MGVNHTTFTEEQSHEFWNQIQNQTNEYDKNMQAQMKAQNVYFLPENFKHKKQEIIHNINFRDYSPHMYAIKLRAQLSGNFANSKKKEIMTEYLTNAYIFDQTVQDGPASKVYVSGQPVSTYEFYEKVKARNKNLHNNPKQLLFEAVAVHCYMLNKYDQWPVPFVQWYRDKVMEYFQERMNDVIKFSEKVDKDLFQTYNTVTVTAEKGPSLYNFILQYNLGYPEIDDSENDDPVDDIPYFDQNHQQWMFNIFTFMNNLHQQAFGCL